MLSGQPDIEIVGTVPFGSDHAVEAAGLRPHVIVIDTEYMVSQVLPIAAELRARIPDCPLVMLSDPTKRGMLPPRRRAVISASCCVTPHPRSWPTPSAAWPPVSASCIPGCKRRHSPRTGTQHPRARSARVGREGETVAGIAQRLYLSGGTVRNYLSAVIMKTGARNRLDAIRIVRKDGWLH
jgi:two-component system response regulator DesR